jgi:hypothetical protein
MLAEKANIISYLQKEILLLLQKEILSALVRVATNQHKDC